MYIWLNINSDQKCRSKWEIQQVENVWKFQINQQQRKKNLVKENNEQNFYEYERIQKHSGRLFLTGTTKKKKEKK